MTRDSSMESVARKYGGEFGSRAEGGMFVLTAVFFGVDASKKK